MGLGGEPLTGEALDVLKTLRKALAASGPLTTVLTPLITPAEIEATRARVETLLTTGTHPEPGTGWPAIPGPRSDAPSPIPAGSGTPRGPAQDRLPGHTARSGSYPELGSG